jgi:hypothetical protein
VRSAEFEKLLHELRTYVVGQMIGFAGAVADQVDDWVARQLFGLNSEIPSYGRLFSIGPPKTSTTHVNQMTLCLGAFGFFWLAIDQFSFRENNETLRAAVLDPIVISISKMLAEVFKKMGGDFTENELLMAVQSRSLRYAAAPTLFGKSVEDKNSAIWLAAYAIAEDVGHPKEVFAKLIYTEVLAKLIHTELLNALVATDLKNRIKALEAVL